jgi:hypothetical protein
MRAKSALPPELTGRPVQPPVQPRVASPAESIAARTGSLPPPAIHVESESEASDDSDDQADTADPADTAQGRIL